LVCRVTLRNVYLVNGFVAGREREEGGRGREEEGREGGRRDGVETTHCKKRLTRFPSQAGMSLAKLSLAVNNLLNSSPRKVW